MREPLPPESEGIGGPGVEGVLGSASDHVQSVLDAAERAAEAIVKDAEAEAQRQLQQSAEVADRLIRERAELISELTDDLLKHAATARRRSDDLIRQLDQAVERLSTELSGHLAPDDIGEEEIRGERRPAEEFETSVAAAPEAQRTHRLQAVDEPLEPPPPVESDAAPAPADKPPVAVELARFLATQMALAGSSRDEIEARLRDELEVEDPSVILDSVGDIPDRFG